MLADGSQPLKPFEDLLYNVYVCLEHFIACTISMQACNVADVSLPSCNDRVMIVKATLPN